MAGWVPEQESCALLAPVVRWGQLPAAQKLQKLLDEANLSNVSCVLHLCSGLLICGDVKGDDAELERKLRDKHAMTPLTSFWRQGRCCRLQTAWPHAAIVSVVPRLAVRLPEVLSAIGTHLKPLLHQPGYD